MSYEIVKNLKVKQDLDGSFMAVIKCASNNVYPRHFENCDYGKNKGWTKEQLEKELLLDFLHGNLQGGSSKYLTVAKLARHFGYLKKYDRLYNLCDRVFYYACKKEGEQRKRWMDVSEKLRKAYYAEGRDALYKALSDGVKDIKFIVKDKSGTKYVTKINKTTYYMGINPKVFESASLFCEVTERDFWKDNFIVEIVK